MFCSPFRRGSVLDRQTQTCQSRINMSITEIFHSKPKQCTSCRNTSTRLHRIYSGLRHGIETDRLCTNCLISRLGKEIRGRSILFIKPLTSDGYCYFPFGEVENQGLTQDRVRLALSSLASKCADCSSEPRHIWMPLSDLDDGAMQKQPSTAYYPIPSEPARWKQTVSLCDEHMLHRFRDFIDQKRWFFLTFRFPSSSDAGYYA